MSTYYTPSHQCRLCESREQSMLFHYGPRHYAHAACGLKRWGAAFFQKLHLWQLNQFPYFVAKDHGVDKDLVCAIENHPEREHA